MIALAASVHSAREHLAQHRAMTQRNRRRAQVQPAEEAGVDAAQVGVRPHVGRHVRGAGLRGVARAAPGASHGNDVLSLSATRSAVKVDCSAERLPL